MHGGPPPLDWSPLPGGFVDDQEATAIQRPSQLIISPTIRSVDRSGDINMALLMDLPVVIAMMALKISIQIMLKVFPSHMVPLVGISGIMLLVYLMIIITLIITVPVPSSPVHLHHPLWVMTIIANLGTLEYGNISSMMSLFGMVKVVELVTTVVPNLVCLGSVELFHRK